MADSPDTDCPPEPEVGAPAPACAECRRPLPERAARCELSGQAFCDEHLVSCALAGCGRRVWRGATLALEGRVVCSAHVLRCAAGHPGLRDEQRTCAVSGRSVCPEHAVACSVCGAAMLPEHALRSSHSDAPVCPACGVWCFECNRLFAPEETGTCDLSARRCCREHLVRCAHAGCERVLRPGAAIVVDGRRTCPDHEVRCAVNPTHVTLADALRACPGAPDEPCAARVCGRPEHHCAECGGTVCPRHRRWALGERRPRYCPPCLAALPRCPTCAVPMGREGGRCPLCARIAGRRYTPEEGPAFEILEQCRLSFPRWGAWRAASYGEARIWERRVGLGTVRVVKLGDDPGVYEQRLGLLSALGAWLRGG